jgi:hypothetical protein
VIDRAVAAAAKPAPTDNALGMGGNNRDRSLSAGMDTIGRNPWSGAGG